HTLAKDVLGMIINTQIHGLMTISEDEEEILEAESEIEQSANLQEVNSLQETESNDFSEGCSQLALILDSTQQSQNFNIKWISELVNQYRRHEAYTGQRMERRVAEASTSAPNNRYSSFVS
ncbi:12063_t:CDS:2, partial [Gigaspora rosea]